MKEHGQDPLVINEAIQHGQEDVLIKKLFNEYKNFDGAFVSGCTLASALYDEAKKRGT